VILQDSLVPLASNTVRRAISEAGGTLSFSEFMNLALYGESGFYATTGRAGRRGDFITSPEVGPLFGTVLARAIDHVWNTLGQPDDFQIVEVGAGPGTLARSILAAQPKCLARGTYIAVEISAVQRELHPDGVISLEKMPEEIKHGVVIANELLDNMAFDLWVNDDGWRQSHIIEQGDGFAEILKAAVVPTCLPARAPHGARAPVHKEAIAWLEKSLATLRNGTLFVIDYCTPLTAEVAAMPWREWLRTYVGQNRGSHYLRDVGDQDITTQVCIDQLTAVREPDAVRSQSHFLQRWGIDELVDEGKKIWTENAARPTLEAMKMRSRISESEALLDESGLGSFTVLEWSNGVMKPH
jgi:SAM-dependent MidA family methyltransferase